MPQKHHLHLPNLHIHPPWKRSACDLSMLASASEGEVSDSPSPRLVVSHGDLERLQKEHTELEERKPPECPFAQLAVIPPDTGYQRCKAVMRAAVRKAKKNILHHHTHECSVPEIYRDQLKKIYVY